jgi:hypothetical protein
MGHSGWSLKPYRLSNPFEILTMTTKTIINGMAKLMN